MKSFKGHFIKTNIMLILLSLVLGIIMSFLLCVFFYLNMPEGFSRFIYELNHHVETSATGSARLLKYFIIWGVLTTLIIMVTNILVSGYSSTKIIIPVKQLNDDVKRIAEGDLDFEVLVPDGGSELTELGNSVEEIRKRLKAQALHDHEVTEERKMLVANLSHDMRTPVAVIKGYTEGLRDGIANTPEKQEQYLNTILAKTIVLEKLVDGMSEYSELEHGRMQYNFDIVDMNEYLADLAEECRYEVELQGLKFESNLTETPAKVLGDINKLTRVFDNLIGNAIKYNKEGGSISLSSDVSDKGIVITISDTGKGIPVHDLPKIFDGFFRGDQARSNIKGNGLGLAIAKQIVEDHHGKIWVKSEEGVGTEFTVYLPLRS